MVERVTVIGGSAAGVEIAALAALGGYATCLHDADPTRLMEAGSGLQVRLAQLEREGRIGEGAAQLALARLRFETSLEHAVADADFIIEVACEELDEKRELFATLDGLAPAHAVLATNSATVSSAYLAAATSRPDRVISLGFFSPPLAPAAVAVVQEPHLAAEVLSAAIEIAWRMGREPLLLRRGAEPEVVA